MHQQLEQTGYAFVARVLAPAEQQRLTNALGAGNAAGRRNVLSIPEVAQLASSTLILDLVRPYLPSEPLPVRSIFFDKSPEVNWPVAWHQDLTIAVSARLEVPHFGPWSIKDDVHHVQPPVEILQHMLTVRLHLDDCDETNGALRVLPGSHRLGRFPADRIQELRQERSDVMCCLRAGDAMLMRPLLLHASGRSRSVRHRRVLHIEYAALSLPEGLRWHDAA
jgi:hypothetical protein